jgi:hypothetical protein
MRGSTLEGKTKIILLLLLPEEIWRPETPQCLKFLHMGVQKKNSTAENYLYNS